MGSGFTKELCEGEEDDEDDDSNDDDEEEDEDDSEDGRWEEPPPKDVGKELNDGTMVERGSRVREESATARRTKAVCFGVCCKTRWLSSN